jgi:hypothetical protein
MPARPMDPAVKRARAEGKKFLQNVTGLDVHAMASGANVRISASSKVFVPDSGRTLYVGINLHMDVSEYGEEASS